MSKHKRQVYAVVRVDEFADDPTPVEDRITIKEVVSSLEVAQAEVARLNELNGPKGARYFWQTTRLITEDA